jgi:hypothetical protein
MTQRTIADVRSDIIALLGQEDIPWDVSGAGILAGTFRSAGGDGGMKAPAEVQSALSRSGIPYQPIRGGSYVSYYDLSQMAQKGWRAPNAMIA